MKIQKCTYHRCDLLLGGIELGGRILGVLAFPDTIDLLVGLRAVMVAFLTRTGH